MCLLQVAKLAEDSLSQDSVVLHGSAAAETGESAWVWVIGIPPLSAGSAQAAEASRRRSAHIELDGKTLKKIATTSSEDCCALLDISATSGVVKWVLRLEGPCRRFFLGASVVPTEDRKSGRFRRDTLEASGVLLGPDALIRGKGPEGTGGRQQWPQRLQDGEVCSPSRRHSPLFSFHALPLQARGSFRPLRR